MRREAGETHLLPQEFREPAQGRIGHKPASKQQSNASRSSEGWLRGSLKSKRPVAGPSLSSLHLQVALLLQSALQTLTEHFHAPSAPIPTSSSSSRFSAPLSSPTSLLSLDSTWYVSLFVSRDSN
jgi:hypothetical protein